MNEDPIIWGGVELDRNIVKFEFSDDGVWQGPWVGRVGDGDLTFAVTTEKGAREIEGMFSNRHISIHTVHQVILNDPDTFIEVDLNLRRRVTSDPEA